MPFRLLLLASINSLFVEEIRLVELKLMTASFMTFYVLLTPISTIPSCYCSPFCPGKSKLFCDGLLACVRVMLVIGLLDAREVSGAVKLQLNAKLRVQSYTE